MGNALKTISTIFVLWITITSPAFSQGENCANAVLTTVSPSTFCFDPSNLSITNLDLNSITSGTESASCNGFGTFDDYWLEVVAPTSGSIQIILERSVLATQYPYMAIYSGSCGSLTEIDCIIGGAGGFNALTQFNHFTGLTGGNTYYIQIFNDGALSPPAAGLMSFCIQESPCSAGSAPADDCGMATTFTEGSVFLGSTSCDDSGGTGEPAFEFPGTGCPSGVIYENGVSWYTFIATGPTAEVQYTIPNCETDDSSNGIELILYSGSCGSQTLVDCTGSSLTYTGTTPATHTFTGLTGGVTYYILVDGISDTECLFGLELRAACPDDFNFIRG